MTGLAELLLQPVERCLHVIDLTATKIMHAFAAAGPAEIDAQDRKCPTR